MPVRTLFTPTSSIPLVTAAVVLVRAAVSITPLFANLADELRSDQ